MVNKILPEKELERYGLNLNLFIDFLTAVVKELSRTTSSFYQGLMRGTADKSRPFLQYMAYKADKVSNSTDSINNSKKLSS